jgi:SAM-dependent methyltransferase
MMENPSNPDNRWIDVWQRKGVEITGVDLPDLIRGGGFDTGTGEISLSDWLGVARLIADKIEASAAARVIEIGCGAGAMLYPLRDVGPELYGLDYSQTLIEAARRALPQGHFHCGEAAANPFEAGFFDAAFSHSVFFYFPNLEYAGQVLREMLRVVRAGCGRILILDVPDAAKMEACESFRRRNADPIKGYSTDPQGPFRHLYFPRSFFQEFARINGLGIDIFDQDIPGYPMSPFRFNVLFFYP